MRVVRSLFGVMCVFLALPSTARAQAILAGTVKDTSGGVMPGYGVFPVVKRVAHDRQSFLLAAYILPLCGVSTSWPTMNIAHHAERCVPTSLYRTEIRPRVVKTNMEIPV